MTQFNSTDERIVFLQEGLNIFSQNEIITVVHYKFIRLPLNSEYELDLNFNFVRLNTKY